MGQITQPMSRPPVNAKTLATYESIAKEQAQMQKLTDQLRNAATREEWQAAAKAIDEFKGRTQQADEGPRHQPQSQLRLVWRNRRKRRLYESIEDRSTEVPALYLDDATLNP